MKTSKERLEYIKQWKKDNPDKVLGYRKKWNSKNREYKNRHARQAHAKNPQKAVDKNRALRKKYPEKYRVRVLISNNPKKYPLDDKCIFCGSTENLEHAHLDYEDDGYNYVTACHRCNVLMDKEEY
jgi:hypothetical protein